ncbi:MAG: single-stranded-DNA-specific exonuclease RecJ [bacterium]|jgi:single-stranded-DNA-specific exonuclease
MVKQGKIWRFPHYGNEDIELQKTMATRLRITPLLARILANRGLTGPDAAGRFLEPDRSELLDPFRLKGMREAVRRIAAAVRDGERIWVYGDYDVDGITSTVILVKTLRQMGAAAVQYYIPNRREEGYGLNRSALDEAVRAGVDLIITVDCGIAAVEEVEYARLCGIDMVLTDHHEPFQIIPPALAVINPKQPDCPYPFKELAGVGVAFKLAQALLGNEQAAEAYLDLVALGTVADIVPLTGENRVIVRFGLEAMPGTRNIGLQQLLAMLGLDNRTLDAEKIAYVIAPRINATGRIGDAKRSVELFLTDDPVRAAKLAAGLEQENQDRQGIESEILSQATALLRREVDLVQDKVIVLAADGWHTGVVGIVASRLTETYARPTVLIALEGEEGKGSARSVPGFNIFEALEASSEYLLRFGGHEQAAGLSIAADQVDAFRRQINAVADRMIASEDMLPICDIDAEISPTDISDGLLAELERLKPFGAKNPSPTLVCRRLAILEGRRVGARGEHLKLKAGSSKAAVDIIGFGQGHLWDSITNREKVDIVFALEKNQWNGREYLQLVLKDIKNAQLADNISLRSDDKFYIDELSDAGVPPPATRAREWEIITGTGEDRTVRTANLIAEGLPTLVCVNSLEQGVNLLGSLRTLLPQQRLEMALCHGRMTTERRAAAWNDLAEGRLTVLVCGGAFVPAAVTRPVVRQVIFFYPCYLEESFIAVCRLADGKGDKTAVHLLYGLKDIAANQVLLHRLNPERNTLGRLYNLLRQMKKSDGAITLTAWEVASHFGLLGEPLLHTHAVCTALDIFSELGLIECVEEDGQKLVYLLAPPRQKMDLETSATFAASREISTRALRFQEFLAGAAPEDILALLTEKGNNR